MSESIDQGWQIRVDSFEEGLINGWAWDSQRPDFVVSVEVVSSNGERLTAPAGTFRRDLLEAGIGSGQHGFAIDIRTWDMIESTVTVRPAGATPSKAAVSFSTDLASSLRRQSWSDNYLNMLNTLVVNYMGADRDRG